MNTVFSTVRNALSGREPIFLTAERTVREAVMAVGLSRPSTLSGATVPVSVDARIKSDQVRA